MSGSAYTLTSVQLTKRSVTRDEWTDTMSARTLDNNPVHEEVDCVNRVICRAVLLILTLPERGARGRGTFGTRLYIFFFFFPPYQRNTIDNFGRHASGKESRRKFTGSGGCRFAADATANQLNSPRELKILASPRQGHEGISSHFSCDEAVTSQPGSS